MADTIRENTGKPTRKRLETVSSIKTQDPRPKTQDPRPKTQDPRPKTQDAGVAALTGRMMPESLAAEAAVLGSMVIDPVCIGQVVEMLGRDSFYRVEHQLIYDAIIALYEKNRGEGIDGVLLRDELEGRKQFEQVGGVEYYRQDSATLFPVPPTSPITRESKRQAVASRADTDRDRDIKRRL